MRTFFTVEIVHGESAELNELANTIVTLGIESTVALARFQLIGHTSKPEIILHAPATEGTKHA